MNQKTMALFTMLTVGCAGVIPGTQSAASLVVKPAFTPGGIKGHTLIPAYDRASIHHLDIRLFQGSDEIASKSLLNAQLDNPLVFANLKPHTTYHLKGYAYREDALKISDDASSSLEIKVDYDDRPTLGTLPVALVSREFNGQATSSLNVIAGGYSPIGNEALSVPKMVTTFVGTTSAGLVDGVGSNARLKGPSGIKIDSQGNFYFIDYGNNALRKITPLGLVTTIAGNGSTGAANGTGTNATFNCPHGLGLDSDGNIYVADKINRMIRKITPGGVVTTFAGSGTTGKTNGTGTNASFLGPIDIAVDSQNNLYVTEESNHLIRKITPGGVVTTFAGNGTAGYLEGERLGASFNGPRGIALDKNGNFYITTKNDHRIRKINTAGIVSTFAGSGTLGDSDGVGTNASFNWPEMITIDAQENLYVTEHDGQRIRKITPSGVVSTIAGNGTAAYADGTATNAQFYTPWGIAVDSNGVLFVSDLTNKCIRRLD